MLQGYIAIALKQLRKEKALNLIKIGCLAMGLASFICTYCIVAYWQASDGHAPAAERTYVISQVISPRTLRGQAGPGGPGTSEHVARYLREDFQQLEKVFRSDGGGDRTFSSNGRSLTLSLGVADFELLDVFAVPVKKMSDSSAIAVRDGAVITAAAAERLMGTVDVLGRRITIDGALDVTVTGIIEKFPSPSHISVDRAAPFSFEVMISWETFDKLRAATNDRQQQPAAENWMVRCCMTYAVLRDNSPETVRSFQSDLETFGERRVPPEQWASATVDFGAVPVRELGIARLDAMLLANLGVSLSITTLVLALGTLILVIAVLNFANLGSSQVLRRSKEIGLIKTIGAKPGQVAGQYLTEAALQTLLALALAVVLTMLLLPLLAAQLGIDLTQTLYSLKTAVLLVVVFPVVTLIAGAYPAMAMARITPARAQKMDVASNSGSLFPTLFVSIQFGAASLLLFVIIIMSLQENELRSVGMTAGTDPIVVLNNPREMRRIGIDVLRTELLSTPFVREVSAIDRQPWASGTTLTTLSRSADSSSTRQAAFMHAVGYEYFQTVGMRIVAGRAFDKSYGDDRAVLSLVDSTPGQPIALVVDEAYSRQLGFSAPEEAVDKLLYADLSAYNRPTQPFRIVGVSESKPLHFSANGVTASAYGLVLDLPFPLVKIDGRNVPEALQAIDTAWGKLAPDAPVNRRLVEDLFEENYQIYARASALITALVMTALAIGTAGLVATSIHIAANRTHEIGVRKTLGAPARRILAMLLLDLSKPIVLSSICAWPIGYLFARAYLNIFMHRVELSVWPFLISFLITTAVAWVAVSGQIIRAARLNPATVLRYE